MTAHAREAAAREAVKRILLPFQAAVIAGATNQPVPNFRGCVTYDDWAAELLDEVQRAVQIIR